MKNEVFNEDGRTGQMGDYAVKARFRRYLIYPMLRPKTRELIAIVCCAVFLATIYVYGFSQAEIETAVISSDADFLIIDEKPKTEKIIQSLNNNETVAGVLIICASRPAAIRNHLKQVLELRTSHNEFPITVSQDGNNEEVKKSVLGLPKEKNVRFWRHERETAVRSKTYQYIAAHYKWALDKMFKENGYEYVIVTEDDLDISPDFFSYFAWARKIMEADPTLLCASAWNDNGLPKLIDANANAKIWRTDFFPGLGWMLSRKLWYELSRDWPESYWDDWLRGAEIRKNRSCLRPEIPRTSHNMALAGKGSSGGLFKSFLGSIRNNKEPVDFSLIPGEPLTQKHFDDDISQALKEAREIPFAEFKDFKFDPQNSYRVVYNGTREWVDLAKHVGIMTDIRGGMPRTAYRCIVPVTHHDCRVYIIPRELDINNIQAFAYDPSWDAMHRYLEFAAFYCKPSKYTGKCDPHSEEMISWFKKKNQLKKLQNWGKMIVA